MSDHKEAISLVLKALTDPESGAVKDLSEIGAVGHRIVHGGENFSRGNAGHGRGEEGHCGLQRPCAAS